MQNNKKTMIAHVETEEPVHEAHFSDQEKKELFEQEQSIMKAIYERKDFNKYAEESVPQLRDAFDPEYHEQERERGDSCTCMDGRCKVGTVRLPGSGINAPKEEREQLKQALIKAGVKTVRWHKGCGAAGGDDLRAEKFARDLADEMGIDCGEEPAEGEHKERVCYCVKGGYFNPDQVEGMPNGFVVSELEGMSKQSFLDAVKLSTAIAFGDHSFGKKLFSKENPFVFVAVAESAEELEALRNDLAKLAKSIDGHIIVDALLKPKQEKK